MEFDKNKDDNKNLDILINELKKKKNPYSRILLGTLLKESSSDDFRSSIKESVNNCIEKNIKK
jgi:hypothetical protein